MLFSEVKKVLLPVFAKGLDDWRVAVRKRFVEGSRPNECRVILVLEPNAAVGVIRPFPKHDGMQVFVHTNGGGTRRFIFICPYRLGENLGAFFGHLSSPTIAIRRWDVTLRIDGVYTFYSTRTRFLGSSKWSIRTYPEPSRSERSQQVYPPVSKSRMI